MATLPDGSDLSTEVAEAVASLRETSAHEAHTRDRHKLAIALNIPSGNPTPEWETMTDMVRESTAAIAAIGPVIRAALESAAAVVRQATNALGQMSAALEVLTGVVEDEEWQADVEDIEEVPIAVSPRRLPPYTLQGGSYVG